MKDKTIVLGISGGIAAYKACELASRLTQLGARVPVVMTEGAQKFVTPLTFQALTHEPVHTSLWAESNAGQHDVYSGMAHIALADQADAIIIAPASADLIARLAQGMADDLLTTIALATRAPILISPAMNPQMLDHPATIKNIAALRKLGYYIIDPETGRMACEHVGSGRLPTTPVLLAALEEALQVRQPAARDWDGLTVLITAGPTREPIDPVRFISNRSSGKMGYAVAEQAARRGAKVILVSGPTQLPAAGGVERIDVTSTQEMFDAATAQAAVADIVIASAAPADYQMESVAPHKLKKEGPEAGRTLKLVPTADILGHIGQHKRPNQILVGFAAETENVIEYAQRKLQSKHCDAIVANDVTQAGAGFDIETNRVSWVTAAGAEEWPLLSKQEVAGRICEKIAALRSS